MTKVLSSQPNGKLTKIVATIGPATETEEVLKKLILAGMNVARFNTKHGSPEWHHERIVRVKKVAKELNRPVGVLLDLQGPEIRINLPEAHKETGYSVKEGDSVFFASDESVKKPNLVLIPANVVEAIEPGQIILTDDGLCQYEAVKKEGKLVEAAALGNFTVKQRKTLSIPGVVTDMPALIDNDMAQLDGARDEEIDYVGLSFVRDKKDIEILRKELEKRGLHADIIAKVENQAALDNLDEVIEASDAIMIARGDLGVEVPYEQLTYWQKMMIQKCRDQAKPVITATHMLETMIESPMPTRAEISDVAHAIYDLTDAVMLSGETTLGKYPVKAVEVQAKIAKFNEKYATVNMSGCLNCDYTPNLAYAAVNLLHCQPVQIDHVICVSSSGATAAFISRNRPKVPVHLLTDNERVYQKMTLYFGVIPHLVHFEDDQILNAADLIKKIGKVDWLKKGQKVLVTFGKKMAKGTTDTISIVTI
ncbi:MAG TPA: pyruvate kinase [Candidatus Woesebacteria bacterium]|nr:pyruvate kinase [Candidatus Woesebacteria bacterium]